MKAHHIWTEAELALLHSQYASQATKELATQMGIKPALVYAKAARMGLRKGPEFFAASKSGRILRGGTLGKAQQFQPGNVPWNAGRKGWQAGGRSDQTQFKSSGLPPNTLPVGSYRIVIEKSGERLERKVREVPGPNTKRWTPVSRLVWEQAHGPVPAGCIVVFKRGCKTVVLEEITLDKVDCITRAQHAARNHPNSKNPEYARLVQLKGAITRQVNRIQQGNTPHKPAAATRTTFVNGVSPFQHPAP